MNTCYRFVVSGRVQGVFFRATTRKMAEQLGLRGWVRNRRSGDVEVVATGNMDKIQQLEVWLHRGPRNATVTSVSSEEVHANEEYVKFDVLPTA